MKSLENDFQRRLLAVFPAAAAADDGPSSRRSRHNRNLDVVRRMSTSEEQSLVSQPNYATSVNMSVWIRRTLVHEMDPYLAE